jgi:pilus assembly protein FimV
VVRTITAAILAAALALASPFAAHAAGLGKITILSPLGQPLNAEIEIVALRPGEEENLVAKVAPPEAFEAAGIEPTAVLNSMRFAVERRGSQRILRVTTAQPVNEPFVEMLVELQWGTGRLVREYTFLLDPPEYKARDMAAAPKPAAPAPAAPAPEPAKPPAPAEEAKPAPEAPPVEAKPMEPSAPPVIAAAPAAPAPMEPEKPAAETAKEPVPAAAEAPKPEPVQEAPMKEAPAPAMAPEPAKEPQPEGKAYEVMKGDTLGKIARDNLPPGITLNQMLVAIYRANQDAFIRENVNLVRAGRILNIPTAEEIGTVDVAEANRTVRAHMAEFREYRAKLAAVPATADATPGQREASGAIEAKPAAPKPAAPQDQVRLSKVDPQKPSAPGAAAARGDDAVARERALQEAQSRVKDLEKNVADLQKLLELKNQQLAELEKKAAGAKPAPAPAAPAPAAKAPAPAAKAPEPMKPAPAPAAPAPVAKAPEAPKPAAPAPAPAAKAPEAPKPAAPAPAPAKPAAPAPAPAKPAAPAPAPMKPAAQPQPEPSLIDEFLENPVALGGLVGVLLLLFGYGYYAWRKKKRAHARFSDSVTAAAATAAAGPSVSEPTLGGATPPPASQPSAASAPPSATAAEEVDPIAEADVYMAYGRDGQAEEILKEALQKDANRTAVHAKLLEIYAKRKDAKAFEQTALKLKGLTNGTGPEWDKAASLGKSIDPQNGLYAGATAAAAEAAAPAPEAAAAPAPTLDFDIGGASQSAAPAPDLPLDVASQTKAPDAGLDFDISGAGAAAEKKEVGADETMVVPSAAKADAGLDFNLDLGAAAPAAAPEQKPEPAPAAPAAPAADAGLSFDLNLDLGTEKKAEPAPSADLSAISLDLGAAPAAAPAGGADPKWQEIATKLDLAKAYEEMGDKDGARELLNEVMKDGDAAQKGTAQQLLAKLG